MGSAVIFFQWRNSPDVITTQGFHQNQCCIAKVSVNTESCWYVRGANVFLIQHINHQVRALFICITFTPTQSDNGRRSVRLPGGSSPLQFSKLMVSGFPAAELWVFSKNELCTELVELHSSGVINRERATRSCLHHFRDHLELEPHERMARRSFEERGG